jgi:probable HAF family extracellular repeat protein
LGQSNYANDINEQGEIVGEYYPNGAPSFNYRAFLYRNGQMIDLFPGENGRALGINNGSVIVGYGTAAQPYYGWTLSSAGVRKTIPPLSGTQSYAYGVNEKGEVVGYSSVFGGYEPYIYSGNVVHDLGLPNAANYAYGSAMNASEDVVGVASRSGLNYAVLYDGGTWRYLSEGFNEGWALGINDNGVAVGYVRANASTSTRAFRYVNGVLTLLGTGALDNSVANNVNEQNIVVGTYGPLNNRRAFIDDGVNMIDLNTLLEPGSGWTLRGASDVNELGEIVGWGTNPVGQERAFLLEPVVPEPNAGCILCVVALGVMWRVR